MLFRARLLAVYLDLVQNYVMWIAIVSHQVERRLTWLNIGVATKTNCGTPRSRWGVPRPRVFKDLRPRWGISRSSPSYKMGPQSHAKYER